VKSALFDRLVVRFEALEAELNALDAATGDGDHGTTILKGLRAAAASPGNASTAYRIAAGGASGTIFSVLIAALEQAENDPLPAALARAANRIAQIGGAKPGDKTMLDALIPASEAADLADAVKAARAGMEATRTMAARRGRAKYVEGAGVGHVDAGAVSVAEILDVYAAEPEA
jgi:dihydroxyacetone kinase-like protein